MKLKGTPPPKKRLDTTPPPTSKQLTLNIAHPKLGEEKRDEGMRKVLENAKAEWKAAFERTMLEILAKNGGVTADEVVFVVGYPPDGCNKNAIGAQTRATASKHKLVRAPFYERSNRPSRNAGAIARWVRKQSLEL